jgi:hypothetical protein
MKAARHPTLPALRRRLALETTFAGFLESGSRHADNDHRPRQNPAHASRTSHVPGRKVSVTGRTSSFGEPRGSTRVTSDPMHACTAPSVSNSAAQQRRPNSAGSTAQPLDGPPASSQCVLDQFLLELACFVTWGSQRRPASPPPVPPPSTATAPLTARPVPQATARGAGRRRGPTAPPAHTQPPPAAPAARTAARRPREGEAPRRATRSVASAAGRNRRRRGRRPSVPPRHRPSSHCLRRRGRWCCHTRCCRAPTGAHRRREKRRASSRRAAPLAAGGARRHWRHWRTGDARRDAAAAARPAALQCRAERGLRLPRGSPPPSCPPAPALRPLAARSGAVAQWARAAARPPRPLLPPPPPPRSTPRKARGATPRAGSAGAPQSRCRRHRRRQPPSCGRGCTHGGLTTDDEQRAHSVQASRPSLQQHGGGSQLLPLAAPVRELAGRPTAALRHVSKTMSGRATASTRQRAPYTSTHTATTHMPTATYRAVVLGLLPLLRPRRPPGRATAAACHDGELCLPTLSLEPLLVGRRRRHRRRKWGGSLLAARAARSSSGSCTASSTSPSIPVLWPQTYGAVL